MLENKVKRQSKIGRAISSVILLTLIAKVLGFIRELLLAFFFGATGLSDAYIISQNIPGTIFLFVGTGLTTCFIPIYFKSLSESGQKEANCFTNRVITMVLCFATGVMAIIWTATPVIVRLFAFGFEGDTLYYAVWFTRICVLSLYFSTFLYVYNSYLQANSNYAVPAFAAIPNSLCIMAAIIVGAKFNVWLLSIGSVLAVGAQLLVLLPSIHALGYRFKFNFDWKDPYIKSFFVLLGPVIIGVSVNEINTLVDRTIASQIAVGGISALTYANSLIQLIQGGIVQPVATVYYPKITAAVADHQPKEAQRMMEKAIIALLAILVPITFGFMAYSHQITGLLFGHGAFDQTAAKLTSIAVVFYSVGLCFMGIREITSRYYYAHSNTKTPMINATLGVVVNIVMNLTLSRFIGIGGLALATSISAVITALLLIQNSEKRLSSGPVRINLKELVKIVISSGIMIVGSYGFYLMAPLPSGARLVVAVLVGVLLYAIAGYIIKIELIRSVFDVVKVRK